MSIGPFTSGRWARRPRGGRGSADVRIHVNPAWKSILRGRQAKCLDVIGAAMVWDLKRVVGVDWNGVPSEPGQPPKRRTGTLQDSISYQVDRNHCVLTVGATAPYAGWLEQGTKFMAARPWLVGGSRAGLLPWLQRLLRRALSRFS